jgi:signal transduction histidine kinase
METYFAPGKRTDWRVFANQVSAVSQSPLMNTLLATMTGLIVVLNEDRQIVAMNVEFLNAIGIPDPEEVLGLRLGESLKCIHSDEEPDGCGTTPFCRTCGAAVAMMSSIDRDEPDEQLCALTTETDGVRTDLCLLVRSRPVVLEGSRWILIFAQDMTQQQFWMNLERVFFHDINNMLVSLLSNSELLAAKQPENLHVQRVLDAAVRLCNEIDVQRSLSSFKDVRSLLKKTNVTLGEIRAQLGLVIGGHSSLRGKRIVATPLNEEVTLYTDNLLVSRVLGNMVINALEATAPGGEIRLAENREPGCVRWDVWSPGYISPDIQRRVFQRHFSTKGERGRGLGTYSMKLFGEELLMGKVSFTTSEAQGTVFSFKLPC